MAKMNPFAVYTAAILSMLSTNQVSQGAFGDIPSYARRKENPNVPTGAQEFTINGEVIIAINKKNAVRKYNNLHKHEKDFKPVTVNDFN